MAKLSKKDRIASIVAGIILFILAAFLTVAIFKSVFGKTSDNSIFTGLGRILYPSYGLSSLLIPLFFIVAGSFCFDSRWSTQRSLCLIVSPIPFFTIVLAEKLIRSTLINDSQASSFVKIVFISVVTVLLLVVEYLVTIILAGKLKSKLKEQNKPNLTSAPMDIEKDDEEEKVPNKFAQFFINLADRFVDFSKKDSKITQANLDNTKIDPDNTVALIIDEDENFPDVAENEPEETTVSDEDSDVDDFFQEPTVTEDFFQEKRPLLVGSGDEEINQIEEEEEPKTLGQKLANPFKKAWKKVSNKYQDIMDYGDQQDKENPSVLNKVFGKKVEEDETVDINDFFKKPAERVVLKEDDYADLDLPERPKVADTVVAIESHTQNNLSFDKRNPTMIVDASDFDSDNSTDQQIDSFQDDDEEILGDYEENDFSEEQVDENNFDDVDEAEDIIDIFERQNQDQNETDFLSELSQAEADYNNTDDFYDQIEPAMPEAFVEDDYETSTSQELEAEPVESFVSGDEEESSFIQQIRQRVSARENQKTPAQIRAEKQQADLEKAQMEKAEAARQRELEQERRYAQIREELKASTSQDSWTPSTKNVQAEVSTSTGDLKSVFARMEEDVQKRLSSDKDYKARFTPQIPQTEVEEIHEEENVDEERYEDNQPFTQIYDEKSNQQAMEMESNSVEASFDEIAEEPEIKTVIEKPIPKFDETPKIVQTPKTVQTPQAQANQDKAQVKSDEEIAQRHKSFIARAEALKAQKEAELAKVAEQNNSPAPQKFVSNIDPLGLEDEDNGDAGYEEQYEMDDAVLDEAAPDEYITDELEADEIDDSEILDDFEDEQDNSNYSPLNQSPDSDNNATKQPVDLVFADNKPTPPKPNVWKNVYNIPYDLLTAYENNPYWEIDEGTQLAARNLKETLAEFKIDAEVTGIQKGPVVTMFEILPAPGVKLNRIVALADNIALRLAASSVRIVAPIPGKHAVGIEVPNKSRAIISIRECLEQDRPEWTKMGVPVVLGKDIQGKTQVIDLVKTPHLLIAGATGAGKSVCVNSMIVSMLYKRSPRDVKMILIDPKIVELKLYNDIPHLLTPVITEPKKAMQALQYCLCEMERRYALLDGMSVRDISSYNSKIVEKHIATEKLPYLIVIIDEFADLMATTGKQLEGVLARLCAMSRAVGIHLVLATQRPSIDVITGLIKANIPSRVAFMVASKTDSRIILDQVGADKLLGKGDMLYTSATDPFPNRIQGTFVSDQEVENVVEAVKSWGEPDYIDDEIFFDDEEDEDSEDVSLFNPDTEDPLYEKALEIVVQAGKASASYIQRRLKIGYNRAARLVEEMEERGIVGPANGSKPREIIHMP